jgi:hypothetical protein
MPWSRIALGPSLAGIPLDGEVLSLDIARPAQLLEERSPEAISSGAHESGGSCGGDDRHPVLLRPLLRPHHPAGTASSRQQ